MFSVTFFKADLKTDLKADLKADLKTDLKDLSIDDKIIEAILVNKKISIPDMAKIINRGITVTKETINRLKEEGKIKRIGSAKGGHWEVIER
jgi:ATP-dependent DNA helicase RecG